MNLLNDAAYWWAGALGVIALLGAAWLTSRTPRRWSGAVVNGVVVLVAGALLLTATGLVLNRQYGWYSSTSDLISSARPSSEVQGFGGDAPFVAPPSAPATKSESPPPLPQPGARVQTFSVPTSEGRQSWAVTVILPADYFEASAAATHYPVAYAGHGLPGGPEQFSSAFDLRKMGDDAVKDHRIRPFITVIPEITPGGVDSECIFGPDGPTQLETWLAKDIPAYLNTHLRVLPDRTARAWLGFSLGGWCGTMLTMRHPEVFGAAASLGGYYQPWWVGPAPWPVGDPGNANYDLVGLAERNPPAVALWIQSSRRDQESWPRTETFLKAVRAPTSLTAVIDSSGGHTLVGWVRHGPEILTWLGRTVPGFAP